MLLYAMWGCQLKEEKKNDRRELPQRSTRYEIRPFSSRSLFSLKKKITKISWDSEREKDSHVWSGRPEENIVPFWRAD